MAVALRSRWKKAWGALDAPWRLAFELAWEAYRGGTVPVGAVVADPKGRIVGRGRNHVFDLNPHAGLSASLLAHDVVNALTPLDTFERHDELTVYTTLEPCALCIGAASIATVGRICYAAADPYGGAASLPIDNPHARRRPLQVDGPLAGPFGTLAGVLNLELYLRVNPTGHVVDAYRTQAPAVFDLASTIHHDGVLADAAARRAPLTDVIPKLWNALDA